jgi:anaerobic selenocysteine-containing dehydrogenase
VLLLAMANVVLQEERYSREFLRCWANWEETLRALQPQAEYTFGTFLDALKARYATYTSAYAERETGVAAALIVQIAHEIAAAARPSRRARLA